MMSINPVILTNHFKNNEVIKKLIDKKLHKSLMPIKWNIDDAIYYEYIKDKEAIKLKEAIVATMIINRTNIADTLKDIQSKAYSKYKVNIPIIIIIFLKAKAYLHWYYKYGLESDDFENSFNLVENVIESYSNAMFWI